jgi:glutamate synthase (NADPH/NADH) large chain
MLQKLAARLAVRFLGGLAAVSLAVTAFTAPAAAQSGNPITIGFAMSLTGPLAANGKQSLLGMQVWEEEINAKYYGHAADLETSGWVDAMADMTQFDAQRLHVLISRHARFAGSARAKHILENWDAYLPKFRKVMPVEYRRALLELAKEKAAAMQAAE